MYGRAECEVKDRVALPFVVLPAEGAKLFEQLGRKRDDVAACAAFVLRVSDSHTSREYVLRLHCSLGAGPVAHWGRGPERWRPCLRKHQKNPYCLAASLPSVSAAFGVDFRAPVAQNVQKLQPPILVFLRLLKHFAPGPQ